MMKVLQNLVENCVRIEKKIHSKVKIFKTNCCFRNMTHLLLSHKDRQYLREMRPIFPENCRLFPTLWIQVKLKSTYKSTYSTFVALLTALLFLQKRREKFFLVKKYLIILNYIQIHYEI